MRHNIFRIHSVVEFRFQISHAKDLLSWADFAKLIVIKYSCLGLGSICVDSTSRFGTMLLEFNLFMDPHTASIVPQWKRLLNCWMMSNPRVHCLVNFLITSIILPQDWSKTSTCEPSLATTLQQRRESLDRMREQEVPSSPKGFSGMHPDTHRSRMAQATIAAKVMMSTHWMQ